MKTRTAVLGGLILVAMAAAWARAAGLSDDRQSVFGLKGMVEVRELVITYGPGEELTVKAHLASGVTVEDAIKGPDEVDRVFTISQAFAAPRARLAVTLERNRIVAYHLATGVGPSGR